MPDVKADRAVLSRYDRDFEKINQELDKILVSRVPLVKDMGNHSLLGEGKRLRPLLFVLCCRLCNGRDEGIHRLSTVFEYIHTSSLLHDDVIDNAETRRKKPSANHIWGNHAAVLEGDFLYSKSMEMAVGANNLAFLKRLTETTTRMTEGQILELTHTHDWHTSREQYMEIITGKTAALISTACACGAIISEADAECEAALSDFGLHAGIAFQLMDDLLDYTSSEDMFGKPVGKDIREGKMTLPLIYTLEKLTGDEQRRLENVFKTTTPREEDHAHLIRLVRENGAVERIRDEAGAFAKKADESLHAFPQSDMKDEILELNRYLIEREY